MSRKKCWLELVVAERATRAALMSETGPSSKDFISALARNFRASGRGRILPASPYRVNGFGSGSCRTSWVAKSCWIRSRLPLALEHHCSASRARSISEPTTSAASASSVLISRAGKITVLTTSFHSLAAPSLLLRLRDLNASRQTSHVRFRSFSACSLAALGDRSASHLSLRIFCKLEHSLAVVEYDPDSSTHLKRDLSISHWHSRGAHARSAQQWTSRILPPG